MWIGIEGLLKTPLTVPWRWGERFSRRRYTIGHNVCVMIPWINRPVIVVSRLRLTDLFYFGSPTLQGQLKLRVQSLISHIKNLSYYRDISRLSLFHTKFISFDPSNPEGRLMNKCNADIVNLNKFSADQGRRPNF